MIYFLIRAKIKNMKNEICLKIFSVVIVLFFVFLFVNAIFYPLPEFVDENIKKCEDKNGLAITESHFIPFSGYASSKFLVNCIFNLK